MKRKRKSLKLSKQQSLYLPDDCWELVFKFLQDDGEDYFKLLSTVSKEFFSITNRLRFSLTLYYPFLPNLFQRFTNLVSLNLTCFHGDLNTFLSQISCFQLKLTSLNISHKPRIPANGLRIFSKNIKTLTSLTCSNIGYINTTDLLLIAECFPLLEELDLSDPTKCPKKLEAPEALSLALFRLRKVNLSFHDYINDKMIFHLFKNCKHLEEVILHYSYNITIAGIALALAERPSLKSFTFSTCSEENITLDFIDSLVRLKSLTCLDLSSINISDELLSNIAREGLPLRRFVLQDCTGYSYVAIFNLLSKCQHIQHLDLQSASFLNDKHVVELSLFLSDMVSINLSGCKRLTESTLFALVRNCPTLGEIKMKYIGRKSIHNTNSWVDCRVYPQLKYLYLAYNYWLSDESIRMFASIFPNLQLFDLNNCRNISEEGIDQVLRRCFKIKHLNLACCYNVKTLGINFEVSKLEVLNLSSTYVIDKALYVISKYCCQLMQLNLKRCGDVTEKGVKHVIDNCTRLREINLRYCYKVHYKFIASMVVLRPSLRKIKAPPQFNNYSSKSEIQLFLYRGCLVC